MDNLQPKKTGEVITPEKVYPEITVSSSEMPAIKDWQMDGEYVCETKFRVKKIEKIDGAEPEKEVGQKPKNFTLEVMGMEAKELKSDKERGESATEYFKSNK